MFVNVNADISLRVLYTLTQRTNMCSIYIVRLGLEANIIGGSSGPVVSASRGWGGFGLLVTSVKVLPVPHIRMMS